MDPHAPLAELETATGATLKLTNQKNSAHGSYVHHYTISNWEIFLMRALVQQDHHIYANRGSKDNMLCTFVDHVGKGVVLDHDMKS